MIARKIISFLQTETGGLHAAAYLLAGFTILSQILGLLRDRLLAHTFGADVLLDVYYAAFRVPDLILIFAGSIVSIAILVPLLTRHLNESKDSAKAFINGIFSFFFLLIIVVSAVLFIFLPYILRILFPGLTEEVVFNQLLLLSRIFLLSPIFLGLSNLFASITQVSRRFLVYALSPVLYNLGIIIGIAYLYPVWGLQGLGFGVVLGACMHMAIQLPVIIKQGLLPRLQRSVNWNEVLMVVRTSLPRALTLSMGSIVIVFLIGFASILREGSIAIFNLSFNLQSVPLSIVGVSYSLAAFPMLANLFENGDYDTFSSRVELALRHIIFWALPAMVLFIVLRAQIVRVVLGSGAFDWIDTRLTAATLALFVFSVVAQAITLLLIRGYYAAGNTRRPLMLGVFSGIVVVVLTFISYDAFNSSNMFFLFIEALLDVDGLPGTAVLILPFAYSAGMITNTLGLLYFFQKDFKVFSSTLVRTLLHSFYASIIGGFVAFRFLDVLDTIFGLETVFGVFFQGLLSGVVGILIGLGILLVLGNSEIIEIVATLKNKISKDQSVLFPETDEL